MQRSDAAVPHRWFLALLAAGLFALIGLLALTFLRFPASVASTGTGPKANVAIWFGAGAARVAYLALAALYAALYLWVGSQSARSSGPWRLGTSWGLLASGGWLIVIVLVNAFPAFGAVRPGAELALVGLPLLVGLLGGRATGRALDGALAAFWCGLVAAVFVAGFSVAVDNVFASTLVHTAWAHDPTCPYPGGPALAACEIGDDLGFMAIALALLPLLMGGIGAAGGAMGASMAVRSASAEADWRAPAVFSGVMLALFVAEITLKLV